MAAEQTEFDAFLAEQSPGDFDPAAYDMQHGDEAGLGSQPPSELAPQPPGLQLQHEQQQKQQPPLNLQRDGGMSAAPWEQPPGADPHSVSAEQQQPPSLQPGDYQSPAAAEQHNWQPHVTPQNPQLTSASEAADHATGHQKLVAGEHHELQYDAAGQEPAWDPGAYVQHWSVQHEQQQQQEGQQWGPAAYEQLSWEGQQQQQQSQQWDPAAYAQQQDWTGQQGRGAEEWPPHESQQRQPNQHADAAADPGPTESAMRPETPAQPAGAHHAPAAGDTSAAGGAAAAEPNSGSLAPQQQSTVSHPAAAAQDAGMNALPADVGRQPPADAAAAASGGDGQAAVASTATDRDTAQIAAPAYGEATASAAALAAGALNQMHQSDDCQADVLHALPPQPAELPAEQIGQQPWQQEAGQQAQPQQAGAQSALQQPRGSPNEQLQWQQPEAPSHQDAVHTQHAAGCRAEDAYWQQDAAYAEAPLQDDSALQNGNYQQQYDAFTDSLGVQHTLSQPQHHTAESLQGGATQRWGEAPSSQGGDQWQQWQPQESHQGHSQWQQPQQVSTAEQHWPQPLQPAAGHQQWQQPQQQQPQHLQPQQQPRSQPAGGWQQPQQPTSLRQTAGRHLLLPACHLPASR